MNERETFNDLLWNLDQALIWVATRDASFVNAASRVTSGIPRLTWILARIMALPEDGVPSPSTFVLAPQEAEAVLRRAVYEGRIKAYEDGVEIDALWAASSSFVNRNPDRMVLVRTPDGAHSSGPLVREPRFEVKHVVAVFPSTATEIIKPEISAAKPGRRRRGPKGYREADTALISEMRSIITACPAPRIGAQEAARRVAPKALGGGTLSSRIDRLRKRYTEMYPDEE